MVYYYHTRNDTAYMIFQSKNNVPLAWGLFCRFMDNYYTISLQHIIHSIREQTLFLSDSQTSKTEQGPPPSRN